MVDRARWARTRETDGMLRLLGQNASSVVHLGTLVTSRGVVPVAIKSTHILNVQDLESLANEIRALVGVGDHARLLAFYGFTVTRTAHGEKRVVLILELGEMNLATFLQQDFTADVALYICCSVIEGVRECHARGVVHQDIKADNVIMVGGTAKLAGMGNASIRRMATDMRAMERPVMAGFSAEAAPEVLLKFDGHEQGHTQGSDAYSLGLLLLQVQLARENIPLFGPEDSGAPLHDDFMQVIATYALEKNPFKLLPRIEAAMRKECIDDRIPPAIRTCLIERRLPNQFQLPALEL